LPHQEQAQRIIGIAWESRGKGKVEAMNVVIGSGFNGLYGLSQIMALVVQADPDPIRL
jgi:hypothetical protein